jgi:hypothetical protein
MAIAPAVIVEPQDLATIVDPVAVSTAAVGSAGGIEEGEGAIAIEEAMGAAGEDVSRDLIAVVNPAAAGTPRSWEAKVSDYPKSNRKSIQTC